MPMKMINVGKLSFVNYDKVLCFGAVNSAPIRRLVDEAREDKQIVDYTYGKQTRTALVLIGGYVVLSTLLPDTLAKRCNSSCPKEIPDDADTEDSES